MNIVLEEADESQFWLEIISEMKWMNQYENDILTKESGELVAIFVATLKTVNQRLNNEKNKK